MYYSLPKHRILAKVVNCGEPKNPVASSIQRLKWLQFPDPWGHVVFEMFENYPCPGEKVMLQSPAIPPYLPNLFSNEWIAV
jgi:hypothetical protein